MCVDYCWQCSKEIEGNFNENSQSVIQSVRRARIIQAGRLWHPKGLMGLGGTW